MNSGDPLGKKALFGAPSAADTHVDDDPLVGGRPVEGRAAMYSTGPHRPGSVVLECSRCLTRTRMSVVEAGVRITFGSVWVPGKRHSRWILCPECGRRSWSRIHWRG